MRHFRYKAQSELRLDAERLGAASVHFTESHAAVRDTLAQPFVASSFKVGNRLAIHPMEGCDGDLDGTPGDLTRRRYERFARGGAKLIWFEATAISEDGRANPRQLWIHERNVDSYARLVDDIHHWHRESCGDASDMLLPIQLTHSGRFAVPRKTIAWHQPNVDKKTNTPADLPIITDDELRQLEDQYVAGARLAWRAGFRAFDVKATHGYLLAELLDAKQREGEYGGPIENRTRFVRNVLRKLRQEFGPTAILTSRLGCFESVPYMKGDGPGGEGEPLPYETPYLFGFGTDENDPLREDLTEVKEAIGLLREAGLQLLNVSIGCPYYNPHIGRPFEQPDEGNYEQPEHPLLGVDRHFRITAELQRAFPDLPMVGSGYSWLQTYAMDAGAWNVAQGAATFVGLGRGALAYPEFARDILATGQLQEKRVCRTVTFCTYLMRQKDHPLGQWPTGCPPYDKEVYGPLIKEVRAAKRGAMA